MSRKYLVDDPERPFRLKPGVAYRVLTVNGQLVVRKASDVARIAKQPEQGEKLQ